MSVICSACLPRLVIAMTSSPSPRRCRRTPFASRPVLRISRDLHADDLIARGDHEHLVVRRDQDLIDDLADVVALTANALTPLPPREVWRYSSIGVRLPNASDVTSSTSRRLVAR